MKISNVLKIALLVLCPTLVLAEMEPMWKVKPEDAAIIKALVVGAEQGVRAQFEKTGKAVRDAHAKSHGCVLAHFIVGSDLRDQNLDHGIFQNSGKSYEAVIRFSNGPDNPLSDDRTPGARGMAIKILGVEGKKILDDERFSQDFLMIDHPVFFVKDIPDYAEFFRNRTRFFATHLREAGVVAAMGSPLNRPKNLVESTYFSMTPRQFGPTTTQTAIKYSAVPVPCTRTLPIPPPTKLEDDPNALRIALKQTLKQRQVCFDFRIQRFLNEQETPINDPVQLWKDDKDISPFATVARIVIGSQEFDNAKRDEKCEDLSLTPWHTVPEFQPLGDIEAARKDIYQAISKLRHELNKKPLVEPISFKDFE